MSVNNSKDTSVFWLNDICVLYKDNGYIKFIPTSDMTRVEQLNAMTRFCFYLIIIFLLFGINDEWLYLPIIGIIFIIILYNILNIDNIQINNKNEHYNTMLNCRDHKTVCDNNDSTSNYDLHHYKNMDISSLSPNNYIHKNNKKSIQKSNGNLIFGGQYSPFAKLPNYTNDAEIKYNVEHDIDLDQNRIYNKYKCRRPTFNNPFMNPSVADFNQENVPVACNADDKDINNDTKLKFNEDMFMDIEDVFNKKNSQRQFFTVAHNIPNDQEGFGRWCYGFPETCKVDQSKCLRYQDLRIKYPL